MRRALRICVKTMTTLQLQIPTKIGNQIIQILMCVKLYE